MKLVRAFPLLLALTVIVALATDCAAPTAPVAAPTAAPAAAEPTQAPAAAEPTQAPATAEPAKAVEPPCWQLPTPQPFDCSTPVDGPQTCEVAEPTASDRYVVVIIPKELVGKVHPMNLEVNLDDVTGALSKAPSDFACHRAIINFQIVSDKCEIITDFDSPLQLWIGYTKDDAECVGGADKLKLAILDEKTNNGEKTWEWTVLPPEKNRVNKECMSLYIDKMSKWGDRYIVAGGPPKQ